MGITLINVMGHTIKQNLNREGLTKKANYPLFVDKPLTTPPHSEAASGYHFRRKIFFSKRPKICGKRPKRPQFSRLRELKCFQMDWKSNSTPF